VQRVAHGGRRVGLVELVEVQHGDAVGADHLAGVGGVDAGEDAQQRRLARAVATDERRPRPVVDRQRDAVEDRPRSDGAHDAVRGEKRGRHEDLPVGKEPDALHITAAPAVGDAGSLLRVTWRSGGPHTVALGAALQASSARRPAR
jgi:hypothetical protein